MLSLFFMSLLMFLIAITFITLSFLISKKSSKNREKYSPFECGFDPKTLPRIPFSLHFFLITVIFLIFDIEIALILPMIITFKKVNFFIWWKISCIFLIILLFGLFHEWNQNMLNWSI